MKKLLIVALLMVMAGCNSNSVKNPEPVVIKDTNKVDQVDHSMMNHEMMVANDQQFIEMMIPHHQEAIDSSRIILAKTENAELKDFVQKVIDAQTKEIADMRGWYEQWFGMEYADGGMYMPMMPELEKLEGEAADRAYMTGMIGHHQGAIMMAEQLQKFTEREELKKLADDIIISQSAEVALLKNWLK
ncbi:MAG: DUF305 domain-containing protein [Candidatus Altimarinota bacterium]